MQDILDKVDVERLVTRVVEFLPQLFVAFGIFIAFLILYRVLQPVVTRALRATSMEDALIRLLVQSVLRYTLMAVGVVMAADQLGINVAAALAGLGIAGIAVGFAAQDSVANLISGVIIFADKPFVVGDWIHSPADDYFGCVKRITLRSTRIRTPRNTFVVIPNKMIVDAVLENYSKHGELRVDVPVGIAYKEDIDAARTALLEAVAAVDFIRKDPAPDVVVDALGDSSVNLLVRVWIDEGGQRPAASFAVTEAAKRALDAADIEIPFPHLQLFVDDVRERVWEGAQSLRKTGS